MLLQLPFRESAYTVISPLPAQMVPYVVTIIVLIVTSLHKKKENQPPEHLGLAYFREER